MDTDRGTGGGRGRSPEELWAGLVAEVATMPDVVANLLREHRPDDQGHCLGNGCGTAGRGVPTMAWPCALHSLATQAQKASWERSGAPDAETDGGAGRARHVPTAVEWTMRGRWGRSTGDL